MKNSILNQRSKKRIRKISLLVSITLFAYLAYSQDKNIFIINPGQKISDVVLPADMYRYTDFKAGTVFFKDKRESSAPINYNMVLNEFQFIDAKGDTLSIADENLIKSIKVDNDSFYYSNGTGYYELLNNFKYIRLVRKELIYTASSNKIGAYDQPVQGGAASSYSNFSLNGRNVNLQVNQMITLRKGVTYHFADPDNHVVPASKKNLQKQFPQFSSVIEKYVNDNATDFKSEKDIEKLFNYLKQNKF